MTAYTVAVDASAVARQRFIVTVEAENSFMAEAAAEVQIRRELVDYQPGPPLRMIRWQIDRVQAQEGGR